MTQEEIQERNNQIALLLNIKIEQCYPENKDYKQHGIVYTLEKEFAENVNSLFLGVSKLKFHSDWNWLMESCKYLGMEFVNTDILTTFKIVSNEARKRNMEKHS